MAAGSGRDILDRIDDLERQNRRLNQALGSVASLIAEATRPLELPPKPKWNPTLNKVKAGVRIENDDFQKVNDCLNYDKYLKNQQLDEAISTAFRGMLLTHIKPPDLQASIRKKNITVADAMKYIEKISKKTRDEEMISYLTSPEIIDYIKAEN